MLHETCHPIYLEVCLYYNTQKISTTKSGILVNFHAGNGDIYTEDQKIRKKPSIYSYKLQ